MVTVIKFRVKEHLVARVTELIAHLVQRFGREGLPIPVVRWEKPHEVKKVGWVRDLVIENPMPSLPGGWRIIGAVDHIEGGNVVSSFGAAGLESFRNTPPVCQHCNVVRRRSRTYVVESNGKRMQVGSSCLEAFTGRPDILRLLSAYDLLMNLARDISELVEEGGGGARSDFKTVRVATLAAASVRLAGWVSRRQAELQGIASTTDAVIHALGGRAKIDWTSNDEEHAKEAIGWAQSLPDAEVEASSSDYLHNIRVLARREYVDWRHIATVCSIVPAFDRWRAQRGVVHRDEWAGAPGQKVSWGVPPEVLKSGKPKTGTWTELGPWVVVESTMPLDSDYGEKTLVRFRDDSGRALVWFATGRQTPPVGERVELIATVKAHETYKGQKQTTLTRAVIREIRKPNPSAAPAAGRMFTEAEVQERLAAIKDAVKACPPKFLPLPGWLARVEDSLRTLPWDDDPTGEETKRFFAWMDEILDPDRCKKQRAAARAERAKERAEKDYQGQGVDVEELSHLGRAAIDRKLSGKMVWLYHGTSSTRLPEILREGITFDARRKFPETSPGVYLTARPGRGLHLDGAAWYAKRAAHATGGEPVVLRVLLPYDELEWDSDDEDIETGNYQWRVDSVPPNAILEINGERRRRKNPDEGLQGIAQEIALAIERARYVHGLTTFGLRIDDRKLPTGPAKPSRSWVDGVRTRRVLTGTSTIGIGRSATAKDVTIALERLAPYRHIGDVVSLIGGESSFPGDDPHELLIEGRRLGAWRLAPRRP